MAAEAKKDAAAPALVEAVVAHGRTVHNSTEPYQVWNGEKMVDGTRPGRAVGPGGTVLLPAAEVERLQGLGFLVKPGVEALPTGRGPMFGADEGPRISELA